jgi:small nuclear ribonucleoprotein E
MTGRAAGGGRRVLLPPINFLFRLLQQRSTVQIWLYEQLSIRIVGTIRVGDQTGLSFDLQLALTADPGV